MKWMQLNWDKNKSGQLLRFYCPLHEKRHNKNSSQGNLCLNKLKVDVNVIKINKDLKK